MGGIGGHGNMLGGHRLGLEYIPTCWEATWLRLDHI